MDVSQHNLLISQNQTSGDLDQPKTVQLNYYNFFVKEKMGGACKCAVNLPEVRSLQAVRELFSDFRNGMFFSILAANGLNLSLFSLLLVLNGKITTLFQVSLNSRTACFILAFPSCSQGLEQKAPALSPGKSLLLALWLLRNREAHELHELTRSKTTITANYLL